MDASPPSARHARAPEADTRSAMRACGTNTGSARSSTASPPSNAQQLSQASPLQTHTACRPPCLRRSMTVYAPTAGRTRR